MKYFVLSDIHNCYDEFCDVLDKNNFDVLNPEHKIIFLGDAFDKGPKPLETFLFFKNLIIKDKIIWVLGNHDSELLSSISKAKFNKENRKTAIAIAKYYDASIKEDSSDEDISKTLIDYKVFSLIKDNTCNYYEINDYIFVHGFVPLQNGLINPLWRELSSDKWFTARKNNGVKKVYKNKIELGKILVCGHVGAYYGNIKKFNPNIEFDSPEFKRLAAKICKNKPLEYYQSFISEKVINVDGNGYATKHLNCFIIEEN